MQRVAGSITRSLAKGLRRGLWLREWMSQMRHDFLNHFEPEVTDMPARATAVMHRSGIAFAARGLLATVPELPAALQESGVTALASTALGAAAHPIDAIFFDKHLGANWAVPGHQDRLFPVASGSHGSRVRGGVAYGEPDGETLARLVAMRIHFDPTDDDSGALCVVPGSHHRGVLTGEDLRNVTLTEFVACPAAAGDILIMRPLLIHRSSPSRGERRRRVLHVVYAPTQPSVSLRWREGLPNPAPDLEKT
jgi:hypothetical protein